jgi:hypothetical protein
MSTSYATAPSGSSRRTGSQLRLRFSSPRVLVLTRERPRNRHFITADGDLARAAAAEGFRVVVPGA